MNSDSNQTQFTYLDSRQHTIRQNHSNIVYLYDLPFDTRREFCNLLDADKSWRELGGKFIGLNETDLELYSHAIQRNESPTNTMLIKWEQSNISIRHLYICLKKMNHLRAMSILKPFVDPSLHHLCDFNETNSISLNLSNELLKEQQQQQQQQQNNQSIRIHIHPSNQQQQQQLKPLSSSSPHHQQIGNNHRSLLNVNNQPNQKNLNYKSNNKNVDQFQHQNSVASTKLAAYDDNLPYDEILKATNNFQKTNIIGSGGFGVVYKGFWKGTQVAIKRLKDCNNFDQALIELRVLTQFRIDNIVPLYGISIGGDNNAPCLIYQFMSNGSLDDRLQCKNNSQPLSWSQRLNIGLGIAKALNYLHTLKDKPLIHGDVKSANILLDNQMQAKLGDFGLAKYLQEQSSPILQSNHLSTKKNLTHVTVTQVHGTFAYLPPEYIRSKMLSSAVDVYSYGVVQLELMTGLRAYDGKSMLLDKITSELGEEMKKVGKNCQLLGEFGGNSILNNNNSRSSNSALDKLPIPTPTTCDCLSCKVYKLRDSRLPHSLENLFCFHSTLRLALDCCNKLRTKRPDFNTILKRYETFIEQFKQFNQQYNQQFNLTGMTGQPLLAHNRSSVASRISSFKVDTLLKTPLEYKLWNELKKKNASAPPLPESGLSNEQVAVIVANEQPDTIDDHNEMLFGLNVETEVVATSLNSNLKDLKLSEQAESEIVVESCEIPLLTELLGNRK